MFLYSFSYISFTLKGNLDEISETKDNHKLNLWSRNNSYILREYGRYILVCDRG